MNKVRNEEEKQQMISQKYKGYYKTIVWKITCQKGERLRRNGYIPRNIKLSKLNQEER